jgi:hypothetical protein
MISLNNAIEPVVTSSIYHGSHAVLPRTPNYQLQSLAVCQYCEPVLFDADGAEHEEVITRKVLIS